ncbi:ATP-binding protein [Candidatus Nitrospira salsa]
MNNPTSSDNQQFEYEYRRQVSMNHALLKALTVGVCVINESGQIEMLNDAGCRMLGWSEAAIRGRNAHEVFECLVHESEQDVGSCPVSRCEQIHSIVWSPRTRLRTRYGEWCWVELSSLVLDDVGGTGVMMTFRDLSMEVQLREDSHKLASIPEESPFPIIEVDGTGNLLYANAAMIQLMYEVDDDDSEYSAAFPVHFLNLIQDCLNTNTIRRDIEVDVGQHRYAWVFSPHPALGLVRGFGLDISERKLAADELSAFATMLESKNRELDEALVEAEAATKAKASFLATMSHEIRTPLNGVIGMTEMLLHSSLTAEQVESVSLIRSSSETLLTIINDILDFSKIEAGKLHLEIVRFDVRRLLDEVLDVFAQRAHKKNLDLACVVHPDVPEILIGDPNRLRQILTNFIGNAIKFTDHGEVLVGVERTSHENVATASEVSAEKSPNTVDQPSLLTPVNILSASPCLSLRFSVSDTGIGISEKAHPQLFQAFSQADVSTTRKYGGTGLGLAISRQLVELMQGVIGVDTAEGGGSIFWCQIPFKVDAEGASPKVVHSFLLKKSRVLCVGCPSATLKMLQGMFLELEVRWASTVDCTQARSWLRAGTKDSQPYTTVLIDSLLSDSYRERFINAVKSDPLLQSVQFVRLVSRGLPMSDRTGTDVVGDSILTKPVHRAQLIQCLEKTREHSPALHDLSNDTSEILPIFSGLSVLVAEDNLVNQKVVSWALKKIGCHVTLVGNGREALEASAGGGYDVVFMDWQMPEMDGLEATRAIRAREALDKEQATSDEQRDTSHVPIIGMTANAMKGDQEQCLHAGMDDYMAKPIRAHQLMAMLRKWRPKFQASVSMGSEVMEGSVATLDVTQTTTGIPSMDSQVPMIHEDTSVVYDVKKALEGLDGDWALLKSLVIIFLDSGPKVMRLIHAACDAQAYDVLWNHVHQLKGSLGALHALDAANASARLEKVARSRDSQALDRAYADLAQQFNRLLPALRTLVS